MRTSSERTTRPDLPRIGHATPHDQPDTFNHAVLDFNADVG